MKIALWLLGGTVALIAAAFGWYTIKVKPRAAAMASPSGVGVNAPGGGQFGPNGSTYAPPSVNRGGASASGIAGAGGAAFGNALGGPIGGRLAGQVASGTVTSVSNVFSGHGATRDYVGTLFPLTNALGMNDNIADAVNWTGGAISDAADWVGGIF